MILSNNHMSWGRIWRAEKMKATWPHNDDCIKTLSVYTGCPRFALVSHWHECIFSRPFMIMSGEYKLSRALTPQAIAIFSRGYYQFITSYYSHEETTCETDRGRKANPYVKEKIIVSFLKRSVIFLISKPSPVCSAFASRATWSREDIPRTTTLLTHDIVYNKQY